MTDFASIVTDIRHFIDISAEISEIFIHGLNLMLDEFFFFLLIAVDLLIKLQLSFDSKINHLK